MAGGQGVPQNSGQETETEVRGSAGGIWGVLGIELGFLGGQELPPCCEHSNTSPTRQGSSPGISVNSFPGGQMGRRLSAERLQLPN